VKTLLDGLPTTLLLRFILKDFANLLRQTGRGVSVRRRPL